MPNWILNRVRIYGSTENIEKAKYALETFDDSDIKEVKAKLDGSMKRASYETDEHLNERLAFLQEQNKSYFTNVFDFNSIVPMPAHSGTFFAKGCLGEEERQKYGENNWYDWSIKHWGVKWNSSESRLVDSDDGFLEYEFTTPWGAPEPLIGALSRKFGVSVVDDYYDSDDFPNTAGRIEAAPGSPQKAERHGGDLEWIARKFGTCVMANYGYIRSRRNGRWIPYPPAHDSGQQGPSFVVVGL